MLCTWSQGSPDLLVRGSLATHRHIHRPACGPHRGRNQSGHDYPPWETVPLSAATHIPMTRTCLPSASIHPADPPPVPRRPRDLYAWGPEPGRAPGDVRRAGRGGCGARPIPGNPMDFRGPATPEISLSPMRAQRGPVVWGKTRDLAARYPDPPRSETILRTSRDMVTADRVDLGGYIRRKTKT
jgi:hypothetical protein